MWEKIIAAVCNVYVRTIVLLVLSNLFMTVAWYAHLKNLNKASWLVAAFFSWGVALFEYLIQVPANRIGYAGGITLPQLKVMQEIISLSVFVPFALMYMKESLSWNHLAAGVCLVLAAVFVFGVK